MRRAWSARAVPSALLSTATIAVFPAAEPSRSRSSSPHAGLAVRGRSTASAPVVAETDRAALPRGRGGGPEVRDALAVERGGVDHGREDGHEREHRRRELGDRGGVLGGDTVVDFRAGVLDDAPAHSAARVLAVEARLHADVGARGRRVTGDDARDGDRRTA